MLYLRNYSLLICKTVQKSFVFKNRNLTPYVKKKVTTDTLDFSRLNLINTTKKLVDEWNRGHFNI